MGFIGSLEGLERFVRGRERQILWGLLICGFVLRLVFFLYKYDAIDIGENEKIARALVLKGAYADAFQPNSGPTAHTGPLAPLVVAAAYWLFGVGTQASVTAIAALAIAAEMATLVYVERTAALLRIGVVTRLCATAFIALAPIQLRLEAFEMIAWENPYATLALAAVLYATVRLDKADRPRLGPALALAAVAGLLAVLSPSAGLAAAAMLGLLLLRRYPPLSWPVVVAATIAAFLAISVPWGLRNERVLGSFILTRSSMGISMAISHYEGVLDEKDPRVANVKRFAAIHPHDIHGFGYRKMVEAGGEVAYNRELLAQARQWARLHPSEALRVRVNNVLHFYFPSAWMWDRWASNSPTLRGHLFAFLTAVLTGLALSYLAFNLWRRRWNWLYPATMIIVPVLPYIFAFPLLRYRYVISSLLLFLGVTAIVTLARHVLPSKERLELAT
jgi:hypothetical protein